MIDDDDPRLRKFQRELSAGTVALVLLALLDGAAGPMYGYQVAKRLEGAARGALGMKQGTLYPVLRSLETLGLLASEVEPSVAGPPRRYYTITDEGRAMLDRWRGIWDDTRTFVDALLSAPATAGLAAAPRDGGADE